MATESNKIDKNDKKTICSTTGYMNNTFSIIILIKITGHMSLSLCHSAGIDLILAVVDF